MGNGIGGVISMKETKVQNSETFIFVKSGLDSLEKIGWYGETSFTCPICGNVAYSKRVKLENFPKNKTTWLYCPNCGMYSHG